MVTTARLQAAGISPRLAEREAAAKRWCRLARGTYVPHPPPATAAELVRAAASYVNGPFVVTGVLPLAELGLPWLPPVSAVHVLVPDEVRATSSGAIHISRCGEFDGVSTWSRYGAAMAAPARAVVDAARHASSLREARGMVMAAVGQRWVTAQELRALLDRTQRNGSGLARRAILDAERGCASPPEAELVDALIPLGVPFLVNPEIWADGVFLGLSDVWVLGTAVGGEVDSVERHEGAQQQESTYDRHERYADRGLELVHISVRRLRRDTAAAARHLLQRAEAGPSVPAGLVVVPKGPVLGVRRPRAA